MVRGIVKAPSLDLANRDLVEAHLHAVWLAESRQALKSDIPHVLDLQEEAQPLKAGLQQALSVPGIARSASVAMKRILESIADELTEQRAPWAADRQAFAEEVSANSLTRFDSAFGRWRQLYQTALQQLTDANRRSEIPGLSARERRDVKIEQAQANEQLALLERGTSSFGSDFYTYRYLATEGFLPGYNFPRLPLYAFVPSAGNGKGTFLQRARFLAIAEFGPRSLVYHEGRAYRVTKAKLPRRGQPGDNGNLATSLMYVCEHCGAAHLEEPPITYGTKLGFQSIAHLIPPQVPLIIESRVFRRNIEGSGSRTRIAAFGGRDRWSLDLTGPISHDTLPQCTPGDWGHDTYLPEIAAIGGG